MLSFPNAKINIGLYITGKRPDGYHNLETLFYPIPALKDALEVIPASDVQLHITGRAVAGSNSDNLVWKAYKLLKERFGVKVPAINIFLHKAIPMGAGMGGGSSDGAFMLKLLNDYCQLGLSQEELCMLALQLGSDCPFFIYNTPHYAQGRGEILSPISLDLSIYSIQLICPALHISTSKAFSSIIPKAAPFDLRAIHTLAINEWKDKIGNDFELPIFAQYPQLASIKQQLYDAGALYAAMSGSGSTIFGIFEKGSKAESLTYNSIQEVFYYR